MLTDICNYLKNWFEDTKYIGYIRISSGVLYCDDQRIDIADGQYFRIIRSIASDGVYKYGTDQLEDEEFDGAVWLMRVPADVIALAEKRAAWMEKYGSIDSAAMSPFNSEAFGGYSYSKSSDDAASGFWSAFKSDLARYRKI